jgi:hypothetical protein
VDAQIIVDEFYSGLFHCGFDEFTSRVPLPDAHVVANAANKRLKTFFQLNEIAQEEIAAVLNGS